MTRRWRLRWAELTSRFHGSPNPYYLRQIERRGALTDEDLQQLRTAIPTDGPGRAAYLKTLRLWGIEHHVDFGLHVEDELGEVGRSLVMRYHIIDRRMAYEAPRHAAMESYVEPGG